ncbi:MAG: DUF4405 domain-containing protein [Planctomycetota bacterium]
MAPSSRKNTVNRALNLALYLVMCWLIGTGLLMWVRLPPGSGGGQRPRGEHAGRATAEILGLSRHAWGDLHLYAGLTFVALGVAHLWLNRLWLQKIAASNRAWPLWGGLALGAAIIVVLVLLPVRSG